jgi:hypothetical protein
MDASSHHRTAAASQAVDAPHPASPRGRVEDVNP